MAQVFETPHIRGLTGLIKEEKIDQYSSIAPVEKKDYYVLSPAQRRMYIVHQMNMDSRRYNITTAVQLIGSLALKRLRDTFQELIQRHESLRTSFIMLVDEPVQKIHDEIVLEMEYYETSEEEIPGLMKNFIRPFNLARAPLMRAGLIKTGKDSHLLITDTHHVISDGVSINILTKDFMTLYRGEELPGLNLQYKDFSEWQNNLVISGEIERQMNYWLNMFAGEIPVLNLPTDFPRPKVQRFGGYDLSFDIDEELFKKLDHLTKKTGTTLFMVLLAVLHVLLSKHTGQEDIVIGSANSGRTHADLGNIIGMFVGQLALRNQPRGDKTFREFLREVKENALQAYENQDYQFDVLVNRLGLHGNYSRHPLFDVVFAFQDWEIPESLIPGLKIKQYEYEEKTSKTDLRVESKVMNSIINMKITYATALFKRSTIERMADRFIDILNQVLENVDVKLADIRIAHKLAMAKSNILQKEKRDFGF
jgi:hypothetical protein